MPETLYADCEGLSLAYQVFGAGEIDLVFAGSFVSHVELIWTLPESKAWFDQLGSFCRVLMFDKAGVGLSDPVSKVRTIEDRAREIEAVMDAAGFERATIFGVSEGGPASIVFAATRPQRVNSLILTGTFPCVLISGWEDLDRDPEELREMVVKEMGETYTPSPAQLLAVQQFGRAVQSSWGKGEALKLLLPSVRSIRQLGMFERMSASPGMARATIEAVFRVDVRSVLSTISVPTLVIHASGDPVPVEFGRYLAAHIPGARLVEVGGTDHAPWFSDPDRITEAVEEFLTGTHGAHSHSHRVLRTVMFSDIVESTQKAASMGDERWRSLLERYGELTADAAGRYAGRVVKSTGDGHLVVFDGPTQAIRCGETLRSEAAPLGVDLRVGIHTGECEVLGDDVGGMAVHIAARVVSQAAPGEVLVSSAVRDLVVGSGIGFDDRGAHELKGVPGIWQLVAVNPEGPTPGSAEARLVSLPTPSARDTMRRTDRAAVRVARRAPWLLRGMGRLAPATGRQ